MLKYTLKRIGIALLTIFVLITITFFLVKLLPGDPFRNEKVPQEIQERQRAYYGLDKPVIEQYFTYIENLLHGDLGSSMRQKGRPVISIIKENFPVSAKLGLWSLIIFDSIGILFGILCAHNRGKWPDYTLLMLAVIGVALPSMVIGPLVRYFFGAKLGWLPVAGWGEFEQMILPSFVLGLSGVASYTRSMRASMLGVMSEDYIKTAQAKGLAPRQIVLRHELKNSFVPLMSSLGVAVANILTGTFVVEDMFLIPGLGKHFVNSITTLDYPLIMGLTLFYGSFLVVMNLLVDVLYGVVDPRIRIE
ncbi:MAG: ABC transporter permease [Clostridia bacterium]|nr:ABC transporter permease [Clostridia bacterium]